MEAPPQAGTSKRGRMEGLRARGVQRGGLRVGVVEEVVEAVRVVHCPTVSDSEAAPSDSDSATPSVGDSETAQRDSETSSDSWAAAFLPERLGQERRPRASPSLVGLRPL